MITVFFYGQLANLVEGGTHTIAVSSPFEAIKFLEAIVPGFKKTFRKGGYTLAYSREGSAIESELLRVQFGARTELHFLPMACGAKIGAMGAGIAPESSAYEEREENLSALFNGAINTTEQGVCRPLVYGRVVAGSAVISAGITNEQIAYNAVADNAQRSVVEN